MKQLQATIDQQQALHAQNGKLQHELQFAHTQLKLKEQDHEESKKSLGNLQRAMTSQLEEHSVLKRLKEKENFELKEKIKNLEEEGECHSSELKRLKELEAEGKDKDQQIQEV